MKLHRALAGGLSAILLFLSCGNVFEPKPVATFGSLRVEIGSPGSRTVLPATLAPSALKYDLRMTISGQPDVTLSNVDYDKLTVSDLIAGEWTVTVTGKLENSVIPGQYDPVFRKTLTKTIVAGENTIAVTLDPLTTGTGNFEVTIELPSGKVTSAVAYFSNDPLDLRKTPPAEVTTVDGLAESLPRFTVKGTGIASGTWFLVVDLKNGETTPKTIGTVTELVRVYDNRTSYPNPDGSNKIVMTESELSSKPAAPSAVKTDQGSTPGQVVVSWTDNSNVEEYCKIYRDGAVIALGSSNPGDNAFIDTNPGTAAHSYLVKVWNQFGESDGATGSWPGFGSASVAFSFAANQGVAFSPSTLSVSRGVPLNVSPSPTIAGVQSWKWYRDGVVDNSNTESSYAWTPGESDLGHHTLTLEVTKDGRTWSGDLIFTVVQAAPANPKYSVAYSNLGAMGGVSPEDGNFYESGSQAAVLGNPGSLKKWRDGISLRLTAWNTALDGSGTSYVPGALITMTGNLTLYAQWSAIGGIGPAGGWVFHDQGSVINGWRYLEAAPSDVGASVSWSTADKVVTTTDGLGNGIPNSNAILSAVGNSGTYAAKLCSDLNVGGYSDWYLPSIAEAQKMNLNLHHAGLGGFADGQHYWTSNYGWYDGAATKQVSINYRIYSGDDPAGNGSYQSQGFYVRPVRAFRSGNPTYSVMYDKNAATSGSEPVDVAGYEAGDSVTVLGNTAGLAPATGYFSGWNTKADGSGTKYLRGKTLKIGSSGVVLYAQWYSDAYALKDRGPAEGFIFHENPDYLIDGWRYLEAAPVDVADSRYMAMTWTYANATGMGGGISNTAILMAAGALSTDAAGRCDSYELNGFTDWYLPSKDELWMLYSNLYTQGVGSLSGGAPGYWSSTETHSSSAAMSNFTGDQPWANNKEVVRHVRPIRLF